MRNAFARAVVELAEKDERVVLLTADLGFMVLEEFFRKFPKRSFNMGVAEGNMVGVAAGMALSGKIVFTYSIATFMTMRCYDHIRNDVAAQNLNVKIVGVGGGFSYGVHGITHHSLEDIAVMRSLPNMTVMCPADPVEARLATIEAIGISGPVYLRLGKTGEPNVHTANPNFKAGKGIVLRDGTDITILATGNAVHSALQAADGISARVISMHTVKPLDRELIIESAKKTRRVLTVEEHYLNGGFGEAVCTALIEAGISGINVKRLGVRDDVHDPVGDQAFLRDFHSISAPKIRTQIMSMLTSS